MPKTKRLSRFQTAKYWKARFDVKVAPRPGMDRDSPGGTVGELAVSSQWRSRVSNRPAEMSMQKVISASANEDFTIDLVFNDGARRRFDVKPYLDKGIFRELRNIEYFRDVTVAYGTVQWKNEQDFAPETLYLESELIN